MASVERVVGSYLELAANDKQQAEAMANEKIANAQETVLEWETKAKDFKAQLDDSETDNTDLEKQVSSLKSQIESLDAVEAENAKLKADLEKVGKTKK